MLYYARDHPLPSWLSVADAIIKLGYDTEELFRSAFIDQAAFAGWLAKLRSKLGNTEWAALDAEDWATHPAAARIRLFWKNGLTLPTLPALQASPGSLVAGSSLALVPVGSSSKLTPSDREKMKRQLEKDYSSVFVTAETMPALCYLNTIQQQQADKLWEWLPWRRILSEEQLLEVKSRRSRSGADAAPDEWDLEITGAALRVQHLLEMRSHAFAMVGACHLHTVGWCMSRNSSRCAHANLRTCSVPRLRRKRRWLIVQCWMKFFSCVSRATR